MSLIADTLDDSAGRLALEDLRGARRRNRLAKLDWFDAFYKAYVSALFASVGIYAAAGAVGDQRLNEHALSVVQRDGSAFVGVVIALAIAVGLRSGGRGGPLAFERSDVRHVLLAPVDRRQSIRRPAACHLLHAVFVGGAFGGAVGLAAFRRLPNTPAEWVICGALCGGAAGAAAYGAAMIGGGLRIPRWIADVAGIALLAWSVFDVTHHLDTSPATWIGHLAMWPMGFDLMAMAGVVVALVLSIAGLAFINRCSIEAAERRSRLVGQLKFAATVQDVRTVMVIQRQLSQEHLRQRPWVRLPRKRGTGLSGPRVGGSIFVRRSLHGLLRWPAFRLVRLVALVAVAAAAVYGTWAGTSPLLLVAGLALWLAALDLLEPLAQEADRPDRAKSMAREAGWLHARHLVVPFFVLVGLTAMAGVPAYVLADPTVVATLLPLVLIAPGAAIGGAALAVSRPPNVAAGGIDTPEIASVKMIVRLLLPPGVAVAGLLPLLPARNAWIAEHTAQAMSGRMNVSLALAFAAAAWSISWIRYADRISASFSAANAQASAKTKGSAS